MQLLTNEIRRRLPALYATENEKDPTVQVKFFSPWNGWTWYATEYDPETGIFFGYVRGAFNELGSFSMQEFEEMNKSKGFSFIERDLHFGFDRMLSEAMEERI